MTALPDSLRAVIEAGPLTHLSTINPDGSPQVTLIWIGLDADDIVSGHMQLRAKVRNLQRDPRAVLSFEAPREPGVFLAPYATIRARATIEPGEAAWELLDRLAKVYIAAGAEFPAPRASGYLARYRIERIGGVGPWAPARS